LAGLFSLFSDVGINSLLTRELAKEGGDRTKYLSTIFYLKIVLILVSSCLLILIAPHISKIPETTNLLFIITALLIFDSLREFGLALNRAGQKMEIEAFIKILTNVSVSVVGLFFVFNMPSVKNILYVYAFGSGAGVLVLFYILRKYFKGITKSFSKELLKPIFDFAWPFAILTFFGTLMTNTDILMLGWLGTPKDIGLYSIAQKFTQFLYIIPGLISVAVFPSFSKLAEEKDERFNDIFTRIIRFLLLFGFPLVIGGILLSKSIIVLIFGADYIGAATTLSIMLGMVLINFPTIIIDNAILAHNQQKNFLKYTLGAVILNVVLNYTFIPLYGVAGAAMATLISSILGMGIVFIKFRKVNNFKTQFRLGKIIIATTVMTIIVIGLKYSSVPVIPTIIVSLIVYIGMLYILKDHTLSEIMPKKRLLKST
jgi:O-antigen/teichoic acid export membrane protein